MNTRDPSVVAFESGLDDGKMSASTIARSCVRTVTRALGEVSDAKCATRANGGAPRRSVESDPSASAPSPKERRLGSAMAARTRFTPRGRVVVAARRNARVSSSTSTRTSREGDVHVANTKQGVLLNSFPPGPSSAPYASLATAVARTSSPFSSTNGVPASAPAGTIKPGFWSVPSAKYVSVG